jgi:CAS/CSE protein, C-terminus
VVGGHLESILGVFQKLLASKAHDHEGFAILNTLLEYLPLETLSKYLPTIWGLLFNRLALHLRGALLQQLFATPLACFGWLWCSLEQRPLVARKS